MRLCSETCKDTPSHFLSVCRSARNGYDGRDEHDTIGKLPFVDT